MDGGGGVQPEFAPDEEVALWSRFDSPPARIIEMAKKCAASRGLLRLLGSLEWEAWSSAAPSQLVQNIHPQLHRTGDSNPPLEK